MTTNVFRETLAKYSITSGVQLAKEMESPAVIFFFAGKLLPMPFAKLRYRDERGRQQSSLHLPRHPNSMSMPAMRRKTVEEAQKRAEEILGPTEWSRSPFPNCWMPRDVLRAARERYMPEVEKSTPTA